ncbi:MAG: YciI family protein [Verrucomicrobiota bacterium]
MSTTPEQSDYMLLFRGNVWDKDLSPQELQKVVADWMAWFERLKQEGKALSGHPLQNEGKLVSGKNGKSVADGPFAESKEAIGGYFYLRVSGEAEAIAIAQLCPALPYGLVVEVRPVADICGMRARANEQAGVTTAEVCA